MEAADLVIEGFQRLDGWRLVALLLRCAPKSLKRCSRRALPGLTFGASLGKS